MVVILPTRCMISLALDSWVGFQYYFFSILFKESLVQLESHWLAPEDTTVPLMLFSLLVVVVHRHHSRVVLLVIQGRILPKGGQHQRVNQYQKVSHWNIPTFNFKYNDQTEFLYFEKHVYVTKEIKKESINIKELRRDKWDGWRKKKKEENAIIL